MATAAAAESAEIYRLPEECVAYAISLTTPGDACHSSAVSPAFRAAADSDAVWARYLPSDHADVLARADEPPVAAGCASKKELFSRLCDSPVLLDGATMSFGLERRSGAKCFMLSARALSIAWGDDPSCWTWTASGKKFAASRVQVASAAYGVPAYDTLAPIASDARDERTAKTPPRLGWAIGSSPPVPRSACFSRLKSRSASYGVWLLSSEASKHAACSASVAAVASGLVAAPAAASALVAAAAVSDPIPYVVWRS